MKKKIFILALIAALGVAALAYYQYQRPVSSISGEEPQATFTSEALFDYFTEHETIATKDLNGKIVQVSGTVVEVLANSDSSTTVVLGSEHPVFGVKCRFEPGSLNDIKPKSGEQIEIKGICTGMTADVEMNQCIYLKK